MKISIIIPAHNEEGYIGDLLESIASQTVQPFEVIVVDSNCTDRTGDVVKKFKSKLPIKFISAVEPKDQSGMIQNGVWHVAHARTTGMKTAKGDYFYFIDADVVLPPNNLAILTEQAKRRQLGLVLQQGRMHSSRRGIRVGARMMNLYIRLMRPTPWPIGFTAFMVSSNICKKVGPWDSSLAIAEDYDYIMRAKRCGAKLGYVSDTFFTTSDRRYSDDKAQAWRGFVTEVYRWTHGMRVRKKLFDYKMGGKIEGK